jgi:hypothetical protein
MKGVFIFKTQVYQKIRNEAHSYMSTHFILQISFIKVFSQLLFLFSKIAEMGILPKVYKCICGFYFPKTPLVYGRPLNANQPKNI